MRPQKSKQKPKRKTVTKAGKPAGKPYETGLDRVAANHQPLTPFVVPGAGRAHLSRTVPRSSMAISESITAVFMRAAAVLASALAKKGIRKGDTVAVILANTPPMLEAHYGVPMLGAVLNALNTRLDAAAIAFMLEHGGAKILITDREFSATVGAALKLLKEKPLVIDYDDKEFPQSGAKLGKIDYETFLKSGDPEFAWAAPDDEWDAIALNYTSGTTGNPKGVVYHHRGAALMCYGNALAGTMVEHPVLLWTLADVHCNGWCMPWSLSAVAGTHVCLRWVRAGAIFDALAEHRVTHLCGAPIVMSTLVNAGAAERKSFPQKVRFMAAAAPPPESVLAAMAEAGFDVVHVYGLTEVYGPAVVNEWHQEWDALDSAGRAAKKARQGRALRTLGRLGGLKSQDHETRARRRRDHRRSDDARQYRDARLSEKQQGDRRRFQRRLVSHRRFGGDVSGRLYPAQGPFQGHHHFRRRKYFVHRSGECHRQASGGEFRGGGGQAGCQMGRASLRLCRTSARQDGSDEEILAFRPRAAGEIQDAAHRGLHRTAQDLDRQDPEIRAAGTGQKLVTSRTAFIFIFLTVLIDTIGLGVIIPVSPGIIAELTHQPISDAARWGGWLFFSYALMQFLFAPVIGNLSDRFGRRPC
jgi:acyl-CoA synthetase (AMP-forming)/AMP-acid ligase II